MMYRFSLQRKCACGGSAGFSRACPDYQKKKLLGNPLQTKLRVNEPGNQYEQEADRIAEQVMRMPDAEVSRQRCDTGTPLVQRRASGGSTGMTEAPPIVHDVLNATGQPLDSATRAFFEPRFGHDFSRVRVHSGGTAEQSPRDVAANAYTVGHDIVFGAGQYAPRTPTGRRLIAHELTHVVQGGGVSQAGTGSHAGALMRQPSDQSEKPAPSVDPDPCTDPDPQLPTFSDPEEKQRADVLKDMLRGTTADEKKAWCKKLRRAMAAFSTDQLKKMKKAGVRFWRSGEYPSPFKDADIVPSETGRLEMARYGPGSRVIQWGPKAGPDEIRHELAHAWDHVRGGMVTRLDSIKGASLKKEMLNPPPLTSETKEKRLTLTETVGKETKNVKLSVQEIFDRFMKRPPRSGVGDTWSFANTRTDPEHVLNSVKEFYAEGYSVFHGDNTDAQAQLLCDAPELYQLLENEAKAAKLKAPDRDVLIDENKKNNRKCF